MSTTIQKIETAAQDVLPLVAFALPLIIPGAAIPAGTAVLIKEVLEGIEAIANGKSDTATELAKLKATTAAAVASNDAKIDAEIKAQFEIKTPAV